jgi:ketosteroid isomerase-like protein
MKKVSIHPLGFILVLLVLLSACKQSNNSKIDNRLSHSVSPDSLMNVWNAAWNNQDSTAIYNLLATNSVAVFSTKEKFVGVDALMTNWVNKNISKIRILKTEKVSSSISSEMVYFNGTYTVDITKNDTLLSENTGSFTFVWKLQNNKDWKMELLFFGN